MASSSSSFHQALLTWLPIRPGGDIVRIKHGDGGHSIGDGIDIGGSGCGCGGIGVGGEGGHVAVGEEGGRGGEEREGVVRLASGWAAVVGTQQDF